MRPGDVLAVGGIDRLGRSYTEILEQWDRLTRLYGAQMVVLDVPLLDARRTAHDLTGMFIVDVVLRLLSYVAQVEPENIRQLTLSCLRKRRGRRKARMAGPVDDHTRVILVIGASREKESVAAMFLLDKSTSQDMRIEAASMLAKLKGKVNTGILCGRGRVRGRCEVFGLAQRCRRRLRSGHAR